MEKEPSNARVARELVKIRRMGICLRGGSAMIAKALAC